MCQHHVNTLILRSVPLDKNLKRFFLRDFQRIVKCNGPAFACDRFKRLRETLMGYRADRNRHRNLESWLRKSGFRITGWLRKLFRYADTQPEYVLQFVKLYCGPNRPIPSVGQAAEAQHKVLARAKSIRTATPRFLSAWLQMVASSRISRKEYDSWKGSPGDCPDWMRLFVKNHTYEQFIAYLRKWQALLGSPTMVKKVKFEAVYLTDQDFDQSMVRYEPSPELYCDFGHGQSKATRSASLEDDVWQFAMMLRDWFPGSPYGCGVSKDSLDFVKSNLNPGWISALEEDETLVLYKPDTGASILDGTYVGHIHHIPKKGTVKRRSIAAPNRFLQMGMAPCDLVLSNVLRRLPRDCTYEQTKLNSEILLRVNNPGFYCGSVDLHQATDHLPFQWMETIWEILFQGRVPEIAERSWRLFCEVTRGAWYNQGYRDRWVAGQPLGALPSFRCLGITHNLLLESLAFTRGLDHSPYAVLGDDVLMFNKDLRKQYLKLMHNVHVPISLQKCYDGNLVEFAGQLFIKNMRPFYNTDHRAITWESLFDYQCATGLPLRWSNLSSQLRRKVVQVAVSANIPRRNARTIYELCQLWMVPSRGSHVTPLKVTGLSLEETYLSFQLREELRPVDDLPPLQEYCFGIRDIGGHPVTLVHYWRHTRQCGYALRYRLPVCPAWYREKFRPVATDTILSLAASVVSAIRYQRTQAV